MRSRTELLPRFMSVSVTERMKGQKKGGGREKKKKKGEKRGRGGAMRTDTT